METNSECKIGETMSNGAVYLLPAPLSHISSRNIKKVNQNTGNLDTAMYIVSLTKAVISYASGLLISSDGYIGKNAANSLLLPSNEATSALGYRSINQPYDVKCVEYCAPGSDFIQVVEYNPNDGDVRGQIYKKSTKRATEQWKSSPASPKDLTAVWIAIIDTLMDDTSDTTVKLTVNKIKDVISLDKTSSYTDVKLIDAIEDFTIAAMDRCKYHTDINANIPEDGVVPKINNLNLTRGKDCGPDKGKTVYGSWQRFITSGKKSIAYVEKNNFVDVEKFKDYPSKRSFSDYNTEEKMQVPEIPKWYIPTKTDKVILDEFLRKAKKDDPMMFYCMVGSSGTGKTAATRYHAAVLKKVYKMQPISQNTTEDDLVGTLIPLVDDEESLTSLTDKDKAVLQAMKNDDYIINNPVDTIADLLDYPTSVTIGLDPESAYYDLTGVEKADASEKECQEALSAKVWSYIRELSERLPKSNSSDRVHYRFVPSPLVEAIIHGYFCEVQEATNAQQQGIFSRFYDVLEKNSPGILQIPNGVVRRHPDFICAFTANVDYPGCRPLSPAILSRMSIKTKIEDPSKEELMERVRKNSSAQEISLVEKIVDVYEKARDKGKESSCKGEATPRAVYEFADAVADGLDAETAFDMYLLGAISFDDEDRSDILAAVEECDLFI